MKKLIDKLGKGLKNTLSLFATGVMLYGCPSMPKTEPQEELIPQFKEERIFEYSRGLPFEEQYGTRLILKVLEEEDRTLLVAGYDRDYDNKMDLILVYEILRMDEEGNIYLELRMKADDKNIDGDLSDDEIREIYLNEKLGKTLASKEISNEK